MPEATEESASEAAQSLADASHRAAVALESVLDPDAGVKQSELREITDDLKDSYSNWVRNHGE